MLFDDDIGNLLLPVDDEEMAQLEDGNSSGRTTGKREVVRQRTHVLHNTNTGYINNMNPLNMHQYNNINLPNVNAGQYSNNYASDAMGNINSSNNLQNSQGHHNRIPSLLDPYVQASLSNMSSHQQATSMLNSSLPSHDLLGLNMNLNDYLNFDSSNYPTNGESEEPNGASGHQRNYNNNKNVTSSSGIRSTTTSNGRNTNDAHKGNSGNSNHSNTNDYDDFDDEGGEDGKVDKKAKRRAAVAAASRATRAKRKRELEELKQKNKRLEQEREAFLNTIAELQMKVQALRETGSIDLRMENDLLRAELTEHKKFISQFKRVADGLPTSKMAKRVMMIQGADTAVAQVLGLISTSMVDPSWKYGVLRTFPGTKMRFQRLPHGSTARNAKRLTFRIDSPVMPVDNVRLAEAIWSTWAKADIAARFSKHFNRYVSVTMKELDVGLGDEFRPESGFRNHKSKSAQVKSNSKANNALKRINSGTQIIDPVVPNMQSIENDQDEEKDRGRIEVYYYRESRPERPRLKHPSGGLSPGSHYAHERLQSASHVPDENLLYLDNIVPPSSEVLTNPEGSVLDTVMVITGRHAKVCKSSFPKSYPGTGRIIEKSRREMESLRNTPIECENKLSGTCDGIVLACTSTQHSLDIEPVCVGASRIRSALLEGCVIRDVECPDLDVKKGCVWTGIYSYPLNPSTPDAAFLSATQSDGVVDDDGYFTKPWENIAAEMINIIVETFPAMKEFVYNNIDPQESEEA